MKPFKTFKQQNNSFIDQFYIEERENVNKKINSNKNECLIITKNTSRKKQTKNK